MALGPTHAACWLTTRKAHKNRVFIINPLSATSIWVKVEFWVNVKFWIKVEFWVKVQGQILVKGQILGQGRT